MRESYRRWLEYQKGSPWKEHDLVFPSKTGAPMFRESLDKYRFRPLLKRAGLHNGFTLYSLRYTFATLQLLAGERDRVIAELMGHASVDFNKEVYQKVLPRMRETASDGLERLLLAATGTMLAQSISEQVM